MPDRTIIFKAIEACNSNCVYCDVIKKHQTKKMDYELLTLVFKRINEFLLLHPNETLEFLWHGGEICLLGADYFKKAFEIQNTICKETKNRISYSLQSNITVINQEIIDAFKLFNINSLGTSYDMIPNIRGIGPTRDSNKYNEKFYRGLELLRQNDITSGIIYVVHKKSLEDPLKVFYHLCNLNYNGSIKFNIIHIYDDDKFGLKITSEEFAHFIGTIFKEWWKYKYTLPQLSSFRDYFYALTTRHFCSSCVNTGSCAFRWMYIDPTGKVAHCSEGGDYGYPYYGHINENSLDELYYHPIREKLLARNYVLPQNQCKSCRFWGVCHGGCAWGSYNKYQDLNTTNGCSAKKIFLEQYFEPVTGSTFDFAPHQY